MAFFSIDDPKVYGRGTERMTPISEAGGMKGLQIGHFVLGSPDQKAPVCSVLRLSPGQVLPHHGHKCWRFEVVVQGSMTTPDGSVLGPGCFMYSAPGEMYGPHVAGPDGCTTVEVFSDYDGSHGLLLESPEGTVECDLHSASGARRAVEIIAARAAG